MIRPMTAENCLLLKEKEGGVLLARSAITHTLLIEGMYKGREM